MKTLLNKVGFKSQYILSDLIAGLVTGINGIIFCLAYATIFTIASPQIVLCMIGMYLLGSSANMLFSAVFSKLKYIISAPQNYAIAILIIIATHITKLLHAEGKTEQLIPTLFFAFALSTLLTGLSYLFIGYFRKGNLIRYIPYPVMCGFLAGLGWAMFEKSVLAMNISPSTDSIKMTAVAIGFALIVYCSQKFYKKPLAVLGIFSAAVFIFYLFLWLEHIPFATAIAKGWVMTSTSKQSFLELPTVKWFTEINWPAITSVTSFILIVVLVNNISFLMNTISIEASAKKNLNINHELCVTGVANMLASLGGGIAGYMSVGQTMLAHNLKAHSRLVGIIAGMCSLIALLFGASVLSYLPKFALFGMLLYIAISFLITWLGETFFHLGRQDYLILLVIFISNILFGFTQGVFIGVLLSMVLFVIDYSKINVIQYSLTGESLHSCIIRSPKAQRVLKKNRGYLVYYKLRGYLFFGTAYKLLKQVRKFLHKKTRMALHYMIFDFTLVDGFDSSALQSFNRLKQLTYKYKFILILTHVPAHIVETLKKENMLGEKIRVFDLLDHAIEWCEEQLLKNVTTNVSKTLTVAEYLKELGLQSDFAEQLAPYFEKRAVSAGTYIFHQEEVADAFYLLTAGQVSVIFKLPSQEAVRLRRISAGNIFGEMAFYTHNKRSSSIIAEGDCEFYVFSRQKLNAIEVTHPRLLIALQQLIIAIVTERLILQNHQLEDLTRQK